MAKQRAHARRAFIAGDLADAIKEFVKSGMESTHDLEMKIEELIAVCRDEGSS